MYSDFLKSVLSALCILFFASGFCQSGLTSSGGVAIGSGGTVTYSAGLVAYTSQTGDEIILDQGVQHAYPISFYVLETDDIENYELSVFPNPTPNSVFLTGNYHPNGNITISLYTSDGQLVSVDKIHSKNTEIPMLNFANGSYVMVISENGVFIKSFKIIKQS